MSITFIKAPVIIKRELTVEFIAYGGGGGAGVGTDWAIYSGGGGGGGANYLKGSFKIEAGTTYAITVGAGGAGAVTVGSWTGATVTPATNGANSSIGDLFEATGGGAGGSYQPFPIENALRTIFGEGKGGGGGGGGGSGTTGQIQKGGRGNGAILSQPAKLVIDQNLGFFGGSGLAHPTWGCGGGGGGASMIPTATTDSSDANYLYAPKLIYTTATTNPTGIEYFRASEGVVNPWWAATNIGWSYFGSAGTVCGGGRGATGNPAYYATPYPLTNYHGGGGVDTLNPSAYPGTPTPGGNGWGTQGDTGGGGGGAINNNSAPPIGHEGGTGGTPTDFFGLVQALLGTAYSLGTPGVGGGSEPFPMNSKNGTSATGIGAGGGGAGWYGGNGGNGSFGGGGGGADGYSAVNMTGGNGGNGVIIIQAINNISNTRSTTVLTNAGTYTIPGGTTALNVWVIGAGGGGAGATNLDGTTGSGGGAGAMVFWQNTNISTGTAISYSLGAGGAGGINTNNGSPGGATSFTYGTITITANGGGGGGHNNGTSGGGGGIGGGASSGGTYSGYPGIANTGGGGGAVGRANNGVSGGQGGSGVVMLKIPSSASVSVGTAVSNTVGGYRYITYKTSGSFAFI